MKSMFCRRGHLKEGANCGACQNIRAKIWRDKIISLGGSFKQGKLTYPPGYVPRKTGRHGARNNKSDEQLDREALNWLERL